MKATRRLASLSPALAGLFLLAACGGGDGPTYPGMDDDPGGGTEGPTRTVKSDPSFARDIQEIFDRRGCTNSSCHGSSQQAGLDLRQGSAYGNLVNVMATQEQIIRVIPGNAQGSYLVIKLEGRQTVGQRMPRGAAPLDTIDLKNIRNWIDKGAKNN